MRATQPQPATPAGDSDPDWVVLEDPGLTPGQVQHALFDFDGTLSLLRGGWQPVMTEYFAEVLGAVSPGVEAAALTAECLEFVTRLTGEQTIYQALELAERVAQRGGEPAPAAQYKAEYLRRLHARIDPRREALRQGRQPATAFHVSGSLPLLRGLGAAGVTCYLASGTDVEFVREEAELLGFSEFFDGGRRIYGAVEDYRTFSKQMVIERIIADNDLSGLELVAFGDGYVEIEEIRRAGGVAVGVASREDGGQGYDPWKRNRLCQVHAHVLVPDWQKSERLLGFLGVAAA